MLHAPRGADTRLDGYPGRMAPQRDRPHGTVWCYCRHRSESRPKTGSDNWSVIKVNVTIVGWNGEPGAVPFYGELVVRRSAVCTLPQLPKSCPALPCAKRPPAMAREVVTPTPPEDRRASEQTAAVSRTAHRLSILGLRGITSRLLLAFASHAIAMGRAGSTDWGCGCEGVAMPLASQ
jgi:hypothetical protein